MTAQEGDIILVGGERRTLFTNPLEAHPRRPSFVPLHTANWRGYVATWEIEDDTLYLVGLEGNVDDPASGAPRPVTLDDIFEGRGGRVEASWFTGTLRIIGGGLRRYVHAGYASEFEEETLLPVREGRVVPPPGGPPRPLFAEGEDRY